MDETRVKQWFTSKVDVFAFDAIDYNWSMKERIERIRAIADEAELRLSNPNWPSKG